ncbi:MAG: T9SS type A sorting domain-containing protein [Bacteroidales bacterium]|nr:T9SS type A sorting domain-containing protein [Bacteroidales bacterium]MCF8402382.1 T9SS type A sorting domain-containing protein [Bacteroidales bacterium]
MLKLKIVFAICFISFLFTNAAIPQQYETYKGTCLDRLSRDFKEVVEFDQLYPELKPRGRRIQNEIEKYPDLPIDPLKIIYQAPKNFGNNSLTPKEQSPAPDADFLGLDDSGGSIPPDVNGCPGPDHLMVTLNTEIRIQDKSGNNIYTVGTGAFWYPMPTGGVFDPKISYDPYENRWILIMPASSNPEMSRLMVAVSETSDPTGTWFLYSFDGDPENTHWFDYPNYGFSRDKIVVTGNLFGSGGTYVAVYVFDKMQLYNNAPDISYTRIKSWDGFTIVPAKTYDEDLTDIYMIHNAGGNSGGYGYVNLWKVSGPAADPLLENIGLTGVPEPWSNGSYANGGNFAPQLGSDELINTVDARMENMVYRHGKLWATHHVYLPAGNPNRCAVQWWELSLDGEIQQWGRVDDPTGEMYFAFAAIAVNAKEDVMIGFGSFSENQYASSSYAFRYADDPQNTLRDYYQYKDGLAPYFKTFGAERNRWGDYTATYVDPSDDLDFWTIQEYAALPGSQDEWGTWWAYLNLDAIPRAQFEANITSVPVGSGANFTDLSKFDPDSWFWIFEGGTPSTSTDQNPQNITYENAGLFDVTLIASNYLGPDTLVLHNYIDANTTILPEVSFMVNDTLPCIGDTLSLEDLSIYNPNEWVWDIAPPYAVFVNGTDENSQNPQFRLDYPYEYTVTLTAANNNGSSSLAKTSYIKVGGEPLPFTEDFEDFYFNAKAWTVVNADDKKTWEIVPASGSTPGGLAAYINIKNYIGYQERDQLISPRLNFYAYKDISLDFEWAYAQRMVQETDSLIVYISADCGQTWMRILELGEDTSAVRTFATTEPSTDEFVPVSSDEWCGKDPNPNCASIDLSEWKGISNIQIMFESYNGYGNNLYLDNISITGVLSKIEDNVVEPDFVQVYPNPSKGKMTLTLEDYSNTVISVYNLTGALIYQTIPDHNSVDILLDLSERPGGVYLLEIKKPDRTYTEKLILK